MGDRCYFIYEAWIFLGFRFWLSLPLYFLSLVFFMISLLVAVIALSSKFVLLYDFAFGFRCRFFFKCFFLLSFAFGGRCRLFLSNFSLFLSLFLFLGCRCRIVIFLHAFDADVVIK